jgi:NAD(P)-dependent dehydrogenase (short-subunit alcohol dehydrogenase family)
MIPLDLRTKAVLITGATQGLGKAIAMEFSRAGATTFVTHRWGTVPEDALAAEFRGAGLPPPIVVECDASDREAVRALMAQIRAKAGKLYAVVSNVAFGKPVPQLSDMKKSSFDLSLGYSTWPIVDLVQAALEVTGAYPRYVLGISSDGGTVCHHGYDLLGASKAALEALCRYLAVRLKPHGVRVNAVRPGWLETDSTYATFGPAAVEAVRQRGGLVDVQGVGRSCLALCSGLLDSITGQVIVVDEGWSLISIPMLLSGMPQPFAFPKDEPHDPA